MVHYLVQLPRRAKQAILIATDLIVLAVIVWAAFALRMGTLWPRFFEEVWWLAIIVPILAIPCFITIGLYRAVVRYLGPQAVLTVIKGVTFSTLVFIALVAALRIDNSVPRTTYALYWMLAVLAIGGTRFAARAWFQQLLNGFADRERAAVYGAGATGVQLVQALGAAREYEPICFIDDNPALHGKVVHGLRVYSPAQMSHLVPRYKLAMVLLAIPSAPRSRRREIVDQLHGLDVSVKTMPGMADILTGRARIDDLREVQLEDLLGRDPVIPSPELMDRCIRDKNVLVTGAGGSIGSELCRQILMRQPKSLVLVENSEFALYTIHRELSSEAANEAHPTRMVALLGSVVDQTRMERIMTAFNVHTVYHAAAYKHVPIVEENVLQSLENNIFGTLHAARAAEAAGVERFVLISTDKAVRPTSVMGASKRVAEMLMQALAPESGTRLTAVRFGNVLGSNGSVIPIFTEQIRNGGPVTVTHPDMRRYFMTIPEASQLVLQAASLSEGGEIFVLDMGDPVHIVDIARDLIRLSGLEPDVDIPIAFTGIRPGEKLFEELATDGEETERTAHNRIFRSVITPPDAETLLTAARRLEQLATTDA
ncbi:MAG: polysaccharide biosynthesis protein, partial [Gammaproteobacteria bacterium]|nr:polysaccharide biosynthesis protein [Gammaproteobacteria bacterium]